MAEENRKKRGAAATVVFIGVLDIVLGATVLPAGDALRPVIITIGAVIVLVGVFYLFRSQKKA